MKTLLLAAVSAATLIGAATASGALELNTEEVHAGYRETGTSKDWIGIHNPATEAAGVAEVCAIYSRPIATASFKDGEASEALRGELAAFINWNDATPSDRGGEISFMVGAPVIEGMSEGHVVTIREASFALVGVGDRLYVQPQDDVAAIAAVRDGVEMVVTADMADGTVIRDSYSLMGVQAMTAIARSACD